MVMGDITAAVSIISLCFSLSVHTTPTLNSFKITELCVLKSLPTHEQLLGTSVSLIFQQYKLNLINKHDMRNTLLHISESHRIHWEHSGILRNHLRERVRKPIQSDMMIKMASVYDDGKRKKVKESVDDRFHYMSIKTSVKYRICFTLTTTATVH